LRQPRTLAGEAAQQLVELAFAHVTRDAGKRLGKACVRLRARPAEHRLARIAHQLGGAALIEHLEMRGDVGFERKALQQRLTERMNGLDLHAAGRIEHARKEPARLAAAILARPSTGQRAQIVAKPLVIERYPLRKAAGDPVRHLGGGRLGEGEAEDAFRRRAVEHQAQYAIGQNLGLACAGAGGNPDGLLRVRRLKLDVAGLPDDVGHGRRHSPPSVSLTDHSLTRARCA
jgi:hypothetical protein